MAAAGEGSEMSALIEFQSVCKYYQMGDTTVKAVDNISFQIRKGEFVAIVGQSGSGKSTCMNIIGCLDVPTSGTYMLSGQDVGRIPRLPSAPAPQRWRWPSGFRRGSALCSATCLPGKRRI